MIGYIVKPNARGYKEWSILKSLPYKEAIVVGIGDGFNDDRLLVKFPFEHDGLHYGSTRHSTIENATRSYYWLSPNEVEIIRQPTPLSYEEMM